MTPEYQQGLIVRALGGFYYVKTPGGTYECKARGLFRKEGISPLVGARVKIQLTGQQGFIEEIDERRNSLIRPPVANLDRLVLVVSVVSPPPNLLVLDKMIAIAEYKNIEPVLAVTKTDLCEDSSEYDRLCALYREAGFRVFAVSAVTREGTRPLREYLSDGINCFCGNTGAGKSSLLNAIMPDLALKTAEISQKLGRGRHTTRHAELYELEGGGYIADTPGFSAVELSRYEVIRKEELQRCFREFAPYLDGCRFTGCSHTCEKGCAVLIAAGEGRIAESRLQSYRVMYEDAKQIKEWELDKR